MAYHVLLVLLQVELADDQVVVLADLGGGEAHRVADGLGMVLDQVLDAVDGAVYGAVVLARRQAEVRPAGEYGTARDVHDVLDQLPYSLVLAR